MANEQAQAEFMSLREAREGLGVSKVKIIQLIRESGVKLYDDPLDKRKKLIKRDDVTNISRPRERAV